MTLLPNTDTHTTAQTLLHYVDHLYVLKSAWGPVPAADRDALTARWMHRIAAEQKIEKDTLISAHNAARAMLQDLLALPELKEHDLQSDVHPRNDALRSVITHQMAGIVFAAISTPHDSNEPA